MLRRGSPRTTPTKPTLDGCSFTFIRHSKLHEALAASVAARSLRFSMHLVFLRRTPLASAASGASVASVRSHDSAVSDPCPVTLHESLQYVRDPFNVHDTPGFFSLNTS